QAKLLSATFPAPKLTVPRELRASRPQPQQLEPPKVALNDFTPAVLKQVPGGARPSLIVDTGEFGSSATSTVNAHSQKVQTGAFGAQQVTRALSKPQQVDSGPATTPVEITFKPNPVYTEEARQLRLQGEVLLEVMFGANGQLRVSRVVRGMGHGLDEAAVNA